MTISQSSFPSFGNLLSRSFQLYKRKFSIIIPIVGLMEIGQFLFTSKNEFIKTLIPHNLLFSFVDTFILGTLFSASLIYAIQEDKVSIVECLQNGIRKFFGFFWVMILSSGIIFCIVLVAFLFLIVFVFLSHNFHLAQSTQKIIMLPVFYGILVILFLTIYTRFLFSNFVFMKEGIKGSKALSRSAELVKGNWWSVSWRSFLPISLSIAIIFFSSYAAKIFGVSSLGLLQYVLFGLFTPFFLSFMFLLYEDAKNNKVRK